MVLLDLMDAYLHIRIKILSHSWYIRFALRNSREVYQWVGVRDQLVLHIIYLKLETVFFALMGLQRYSRVAVWDPHPGSDGKNARVMHDLNRMGRTSPKAWTAWSWR